MTAEKCLDCIRERTEYGVQWCPAHYSEDADNARAIEQTGTGIPDVVAKQKHAIREKCIAANPEIERRYQAGASTYIEGRPIRLADVLNSMWLGEFDNDATLHKEQEDVHAVVTIWDLRADDLDQQSDATIEFIHSLLCV